VLNIDHGQTEVLQCDWIENIRMLFWRLEYPNTWPCDFDRVFTTVDKDEEEVMKWENKEKREQEHKP
jgi:hypothetical protein